MVDSLFLTRWAWNQVIARGWGLTGVFGSGFFAALALFGGLILFATSYNEAVVIVDYHSTALVYRAKGTRVLAVHYDVVERNRYCPSKVEYSLVGNNTLTGEPVVWYITDSSNGPPIPDGTKRYTLKFELPNSVEAETWDFKTRSADTCQLIIPWLGWKLPIEHTNVRTSAPIPVPVPEL